MCLFGSGDGHLRAVQVVNHASPRWAAPSAPRSPSKCSSSSTRCSPATSITSLFGYGRVNLQTRKHNSPYVLDDLIYYLFAFLVCAVFDGGIGKPSEEQGYCQCTCLGKQNCHFSPCCVASLSTVCLVLKLSPFGL
jgi:hypothetical protein